MQIPPALEGRLTTTVEVAAEVLGIGRNQAYAAVRDGTIPSRKIGGRIVVLVSPLLESLGVRDSPRGEQRDAAKPNAA